MIALTAAVTVIAALLAVAVLTGRDRTDRTGAAPSALPAPQNTGDRPGATPEPSTPGPSSAAATPSAIRTPARTGTAKRSASTAGTPDAAANPGGTDLALGRPATASSVEGEAYAPRFAVDGDPGTRWSSAFSDPQWISVDLGRLWLVTRVVLRWEAAYGVEHDLAVSADGTTWRRVWRTGEGAGGVQDVRIAATPARFVRMTGTRRVGQYGYSLFAFEVR
ncbi:discoidin domain-containing protein [Dactylosporangium cerinum]